MKISIILGTRPEIIKLSPIIRECEKLSLDYFIIHSGQHYTFNIDEVFFEQLKLPMPKYNLKVGSGTHAEQTAKILLGIEKVLQKEGPNIVLVEGDTNTVLASALAASKLGIKIGHVEAGLRSYDRQMPEEINRILTDHCSDLLFAPTEKSRKILIHEGIQENKIFVTGNTIVDAIYQNYKKIKEKSRTIDCPGISKNNYFLATVHRQENVDNKEKFRGIIRGLNLIAAKFGLQIIYPIHPRSLKQMKLFNIEKNNLHLIEPLDYFSFLELEKNARLILTDSGGVQEEACILKVPCVTLRNNTERPETLEAGSNILAGTNPHNILLRTEYMLKKSREWINPFGDGNAGERIINIVQKNDESRF
ncbi:MAG: UDP-N-acetylglucosamine 2-epimerase (non-hydrolyzing) [Candidatus Bathyarchaeota archaeon]|nr:UDP-N-acetylglucosamine 2-epimerase (non-hydrolyzing) [Candidatus Bathyarchaeota archaeon]